MLKQLRSVLPPRLIRVCERVLGLANDGHKRIGEQAPEFYDCTFEADDSWRRHYTESPYYFVWTVILDRLRRAEAKRILEIACGSGQLARAILDARIVTAYRGFDFSHSRLQHARRLCPEFHFEVADAHTTHLFDVFDYDTTIATEFLEHIEGDLDVLCKLRAGTRFLGTVPSFPFVSHVRHFTNVEDVANRYQLLFDAFSVVALPANERGKTFFLMEGLRNATLPPLDGGSSHANGSHT